MTVKLLERHSHRTESGLLFSLGEAASAIGSFCRSEWKDTPVLRVSTDSRVDCSGALFVALRGERFKGEDFVCEAFAKGAAAAVVQSQRFDWNPEWKILYVRDTLKALAQLASYRRNCLNIPIIAITGSCGKTTTKELLAAALATKYRVAKSQENFNNIIGVSHTILSVKPEDEVLVIELGTNAPGEIAQLAAIVRPTVAIITLIGHTHLEKLGSVEGVKKEKGTLLNFLMEGGIFVTNNDCRECRELAAEFPGETITVAVEQEADVTASVLDEEDSDLLIQIDDFEQTLPLAGKHNVTNALLAAATAEKLGVERKEAFRAFSAATLPKLRMQSEIVCGVLIIDDSYNSNFEALKAAIHHLESISVRGRKFLVVGDMLELGTATECLHKAIGWHIGRSRIDTLITVGNWAGLIAEEAHRGHTTEIFQRRSLDEIAPLLMRITRPGDAVLFKASRAVHLDRAVEEFKRQLRANHLVTVNSTR